jgi:osmotically-inducible protein OsmY
VVRELGCAARVDDTHVGVHVDVGVGTLTGTVASYADKLAAQDAVHRVAGGLEVANSLHVQVPGSLERTDTAMAQAARHRPLGGGGMPGRSAATAEIMDHHPMSLHLRWLQT